ncbi:piggyBac transposable element-derived protein 4 [Solenopsis invicta]|uniref:piggyBac transposable element-derived protein 4 n=1 Tax=Solenopsis invicta TaxID=13686 RepID=UPI00193E1E4A|nr:piggyBac transposable element-derived protein 4 [Solenopsis invicta]
MSFIYSPGKELSLDESIVLWRGQLIFCQYIKNKRHKYGIKLYMLTEPSSVILKSLVYTGALDDTSGKGHATKILLHLLQERLDSGHSIYTDNFYNSFELAHQLTSRATYCTGTLNSRRKSNPKAVLTKKLKQGETIAAYSNNIFIRKWKNNQDVLYISNEHGNDMIEYEDRRNRSRTKPAPIYYYNKYMGGVDRQDQLNAYYPSHNKTVRWYKKLGIHFIQLMVLNSHLLYKQYSGNKMSLYDFRLSLLSSLLLYRRK